MQVGRPWIGWDGGGAFAVVLASGGLMMRWDVVVVVASGLQR